MHIGFPSNNRENPLLSHKRHMYNAEYPYISLTWFAQYRYEATSNLTTINSSTEFARQTHLTRLSTFACLSLVICLAAWFVSQPVACNAASTSCCEASAASLCTFIILLALNSSFNDITSCCDAAVSGGLVPTWWCWCWLTTCKFTLATSFVATGADVLLVDVSACSRLGWPLIRLHFAVG